jgi:hypothetical protein
MSVARLPERPSPALAAPASAAADDTLHRLLHAVEAQLEAARRADAAGLQTTSAERAQLQRALDVEALRRADADTRAEAARVALRIRGLDARIQACGRTVLSAIAALAPERPPETYGRRGDLRGVR